MWAQRRCVFFFRADMVHRYRAKPRCAQCIIPGLLDVGANLTFAVGKSTGAALLTKHKIWHDDLLNIADGSRYLKKYIDAILHFATTDQSYDNHGGPWELELEDVVLVSGASTTTDWAVLTFKHWEANGAIGFQLGVATVGAANTGIWGSFTSTSTVHQEAGPDPTITCPNCASTVAQPGVWAEAQASATQCVFIRGWRIRRRPLALHLLGPKVIKAGAGEHIFDPDRSPDPSASAVLADDEDMEYEAIHLPSHEKVGVCLTHDSAQKLTAGGLAQVTDPLEPIFDYLFSVCDHLVFQDHAVLTIQQKSHALTVMAHDYQWSKLLAAWVGTP